MKKILFILIFNCINIYGQNTGIVRGKIETTDGFPVSNLLIKQEKNGISIKTDKKGEFTIPNFPLGIHTLVLEGEKIKKQTKEILVKENETYFVIFTLNEVINELKEIVIKIKDSPNKKKETILSGLEIKPFDLPQSLQIVGNSTLLQQQTIRLSDVLKNVNGVYIGSSRGGAQESLWSRGYEMTATNIFKNGFRMNGGAMPEVATLDKVEILKGGSALLFGNVTPGGIVNMVTKKPLFKNGGEISYQIGSNSFNKPTIDFYGPFSKKVAYRLISTYEKANSFRDIVTTDRFYINPSLVLKSKKSEFILQGDYLKDNWIPDFGTGSIGTTIVDIPRNTYLGATWSNGQTFQSSLSSQLKYKLNENWKLNINSAFQNFERSWKGTERIQPIENGNWNRPLGQYKINEQLIVNQINLSGTYKTGKIKHQLFTGLDIDNSIADAYTYVFNPFFYDTINIFNLNLYTQNTFIPEATNTRIVQTTTNNFGIYFQDLISIKEKIKILAGIRWSWQEAKAENNNLISNSITTDDKRISSAFSPKIGIVYQPNNNTSVFTSYSNSFTPNTGVTIYNETLKPSLIDQYEIGLKKDCFKGLLSTNITFYTIINNNLAQTAELNLDGTPNTNSNIKTLNGETTSQGIEIDISSSPIEGLTVLAGYSYNDMKFTKSNGAFGSFVEGERLTRTPYNTGNFSAFYTTNYGKLNGLSFGIIGNYIGERLGGWNNTYGQTMPDRKIPISGFTTFDLSIGYKWKSISILSKLSNIANVLNYTVHENYSMNPIAPRQIMTTFNYKF
ncbi:MAG: TonB-dependent receptor [Flavobacterium sp.]|nr:TonB-dependent receptor [Flavobacterium sp.]